MTITDLRPLAVVLAAAAACTTACAATDAPPDAALQIHVTFAPLGYLAERIAGPEADVVNLTPPGTDPHNVELSPATTAELARSDLVVTVSGLQPATDAAIAAVEPAHVLDALEVATVPLPDAGTAPDPARDPHFWLDPVRFGLAAELVAAELGRIDPAGADDYLARADALVGELDVLDREYRTALSPCAGATLVTAHEAFGYLAARYQLRQEGVTGIDPEVEPSPARLRGVQVIVERTGVSTLFFETSADPGVAERLAADLGVVTAVLDPMERAAELDYPQVMRTNLEALTAGLVCES